MIMGGTETDPSSRVTGDKKKAGVIRKYGLNMSRQAFREKAEDIGFKKVRGLKSMGFWEKADVLGQVR